MANVKVALYPANRGVHVTPRPRLVFGPTSGGQGRVGASAQRAGEHRGQAQPSGGRERDAAAEDHRGGDLQTGAAQRAGEDQRGESRKKRKDVQVEFNKSRRTGDKSAANKMNCSRSESRFVVQVGV